MKRVFDLSLLQRAKNLLLVLLLLSGGIRLSGLETGETSGAAATEGRGGGEADVLLGVDTNDERGNGDHLLADGDVALADEDTSVVDGLGHAALVDLGLEATLEQIAVGQRQDKIELVLLLIEDTDALEATEEGSSLEDATGVVDIEGQKGTGSLASLGEDQVCAPQLRLVLQAELSDQTELLLETLLLIRTARSVRGNGVCFIRKDLRSTFPFHFSTPIDDRSYSDVHFYTPQTQTKRMD